MGWVDTERERVEWFWDPGSLLFRGPPYSTLMKGHQQQ
jgi:hypothetical protein